LGASLRNLLNRNNIISQGYKLVFVGPVGSSATLLETFQNESLRLTPDFVFRISF